ncbi:hypothetical protein GT3570_10555 [Geobacillus thermoleovorans]|uniref:Uncharacterized protein n=4 Tax=Geobacillus TaxID=129337 RepID=Q5KXT5_GEOKA|nr:hypothetical protein GT3570_10555 [Geobacillus thermoleovorans]AUI38072.1 hypothetical protein CWI35_17340 [[Bacillus] caldolyticus]EPR28145.1 hypothetical protein I656_02156 [Geobacillus sp. WSUCF1]EQB96121.1 hypothetical protein GA8_08150 [Geobacillus sp. A8]ESU71250.1 hypothetical protein T260_14415 [Geobacillus sp. MAS1]KDE47919.1 hypothetical protein DI44_11170 [Geobacillus sp. CAMR5420]OQP25168.1 hypothetical protein B1694_00660 [Geobacillus zalihae]BAD76501.1 hypothetical protein G
MFTTICAHFSAFLYIDIQFQRQEGPRAAPAQPIILCLPRDSPQEMRLCRRLKPLPNSLGSSCFRRAQTKPRARKAAFFPPTGGDMPNLNQLTAEIQHLFSQKRPILGIFHQNNDFR